MEPLGVVSVWVQGEEDQGFARDTLTDKGPTVTVGNTDGIADAIRTSTCINECVLLIDDLLFMKE